MWPRVPLRHSEDDDDDDDNTRVEDTNLKGTHTHTYKLKDEMVGASRNLKETTRLV